MWMALVLLNCSAGLGIAANRHHFVCLHYHKTGSEFCGAIASKLAQECNSTIGFDQGWSTEKSINAAQYYHTSQADFLQDNDLIVTRPLGLAGDWKHIFDFPGHSYSIILMVRDPFEIILSAYKYHSQHPPPERWLLDKPYKVCSIAPYLSMIGAPLGHYISNTSLFTSWATTIADTCKHAVAMFPPGSTYLHQLTHTVSLRNAEHIFFDQPAAERYRELLPKYEHNETEYGPDIYPAVRLEAFRSLNEIVYMAVSKLFEEPTLSLAMHLEEFGIGNLAQFRNGAKKMMGFHMSLMDQHSKESNCSLCLCLDLKKAARLTEEASFVPLPAPKADPAVDNTTTNVTSNDTSTATDTSTSRRLSSHKATHVTTNLMAIGTKQMYMRRLAADPVLGPLLNLIAGIVNTPTPQPYQQRMIGTLPPVSSSGKTMPTRGLASHPMAHSSASAAEQAAAARARQRPPTHSAQRQSQQRF